MKAVLVFTALLVLSTYSSASAYELQPWHWNTRCFTHDGSPEIVTALATWARVANIADCGKSDDPAIKLRIVEGLPGLNQIGGADCETINSPMVYQRCTILVKKGETKDPRVVLHEVGHALGMGHSDDPYAVMWPSMFLNNGTLSPDDIAGIQAIYGPPIVMDHFTLSDWRWADSCFTHSDVREVVAALSLWATAANISDCGVSATPEISFEVAPAGYFTGQTLGEAESSAIGSSENGPFMFAHCTIRVRPGYEHDQRVVSHELGHCLGMNHSADANALMAPFLSPTNRGTLSTDDIAGIRAIYGPRVLRAGSKLFLQSIARE